MICPNCSSNLDASLSGDGLRKSNSTARLLPIARHAFSAPSAPTIPVPGYEPPAARFCIIDCNDGPELCGENVVVYGPLDRLDATFYVEELNKRGSFCFHVLPLSSLPADLPPNPIRQPPPKQPAPKDEPPSRNKKAKKIDVKQMPLSFTK